MRYNHVEGVAMLEATIELDQGLSGKWFDVRLQWHLFQGIKQAIKF